MKNTPNAVTSVGMMMAPTVPVQPNCRMRMNSGMMPSWVGMAMVATTNTMSALLLRNRSLANAKPASVEKVTTFSVVTFSTLAGFAFAKLRFRSSNALMVFVVATMAIPTQLGIIPLFILMRQFGWTGTVGAIIIPTLVTAFGVFFMRQYLVDVIPDELIDAARVDGANTFSTFWHVAVPAARPAMAILALFTFMMAWTDFLWPMIVSPQNPTLQVALSQLQSARYVDFSVVLAGAVLATLPLLILFVVAGRQLISGIMAGAVKG